MSWSIQGLTASATEIPDDIMQQALALVARSTDGNSQPSAAAVQTARRGVDETGRHDRDGL